MEQITYDVSDMTSTNGSQSFVDNRYRLEVDGKEIETWELMVMESAKITDWLMVFSFYLVSGNGRISPELSKKPIDEMNRAELAQVQNSSAYKWLKRRKIPELKACAEQFKQALEFNDPN